MAVNLVANTAKFVKGLKSAEKSTLTFKSALATVGKGMLSFGGIAAAVSAGGMASFIRSQLISIDLLGKQSANLGMTTEALSALQHAAGIMGVESGSLNIALRRMEKSISDAGVGMSTAVRGLGQLGLTVKDLRGLSPEKQFARMGEALSRVRLQSDKARIAQDLFGRAGVSLIKTLELGSAGLKKFAEDAKRLGGIVNGDTVASVEELNDSIRRFWMAMNGLGRSIMVNLVAPLTKALKVMTELVVMIGEIPGMVRWMANMTPPMPGSLGGSGGGGARRTASQSGWGANGQWGWTTNRQDRLNSLDRILSKRAAGVGGLNTTGGRPLTPLGGKRDLSGMSSAFGRVLTQLSATLSGLTIAAAIGRQQHIKSQRYAGLAERGTVEGYRASQRRNQPMKQIADTAKKQLAEVKIHTGLLKDLGIAIGHGMGQLATIPSL